MAEARVRHDWRQTSELLAAVYNTIRDPEKRKEPFAGSDFDPTAELGDGPDAAAKPATKAKPLGIEAFGRLAGMSPWQSFCAARGIGLYADPPKADPTDPSASTPSLSEE